MLLSANFKSFDYRQTQVHSANFFWGGRWGTKVALLYSLTDIIMGLFLPSTRLFSRDPRAVERQR